ncbi:glycosyltransferase family 2 protein [Leifsonia sp. 22587]|uniref:glycosyltransferase family 2 protein n=1 Tax=Leifsonia sp. 22587 TaxID=3453946 RepID=UPI003F835296
MRLAVTLMVRDEADIVRPVIDNLIDQGADAIIVTDNGSVDGTTEILESYGDRIDLRHDPVQRKQQFRVVTGMARDAHTVHGADWVINADADEFWLPRVAGRTLHDVFSELPKSLRTFPVEVIDMIGDPALRGSGLQRLTLQDRRPLRRMNELGLHAHATSDAVHVGTPEIEVSQGNHFVNLQQKGEVPPGLEVDVLHFPWRSWEQFEGKVEKSGRAYEANPELQPSPNHHGMREYRRYLQGTLFAFYVLRHPTEEERTAGLADGTLVEDRRVADAFSAPVADVPVPDDRLAAARTWAPAIALQEEYARAQQGKADARLGEVLQYLDDAKHRIDGLIDDLKAADAREQRVREELSLLRSRKVVRWADAVGRLRPGR